MDEEVVPRHSGLPDWTRVEGLCPRCIKQSSFDQVQVVPVAEGRAGLGDSLAGRSRSTTERVGVLKCRNCGQGTVVVERLERGAPIVIQGISMDALRAARVVPIHWWPTVGGTVHEAVPLPIRSALEEAHTTLGAGCYRSATIMARHALEALTEDQGATKYSLDDRLKEMVAAHKLQPSLAAWATEVRLVGNAGAHNPLAAVPREDAEDLLDFMRELVNYLYVLPFELKERRKKKSAGP